MKHEESGGLTLYSYWRSSAAYRVRIALHLKDLDFETVPVHLVRNGGEQHSASYLALNPQGRVPVLTHGERVLTQSSAICEYLDEVFPAYTLLPADPFDRAWVRSLVQQIACEIHPLNNLRVQNYLKEKLGDGVDAVTWMRHWMHEGFAAMETQLDDSRPAFAGRPGLFECFLVPQAYNAERYGIDLSAYPAINEVVDRCRRLESFIRAAPENQPDAEPV
jgi:maleylacetoacetate isomerase